MPNNKFFHQFIGQPCYIPDWPLKHLFIGTFNPSYGRRVSYYYGRCENRAWELLSKVFGVELDPDTPEFLDRLKDLQIGCMDMIASVELPKGVAPPEGYRDADIINGRVMREYNTDAIIGVIRRNLGLRVYSTWGNGPTLQAWKQEIGRVGSMVSLVSPSMVAWVPKGTKKFEHMLKDWREKVKPV